MSEGRQRGAAPGLESEKGDRETLMKVKRVTEEEIKREVVNQPALCAF